MNNFYDDFDDMDEESDFVKYTNNIIQVSNFNLDKVNMENKEYICEILLQMFVAFKLLNYKITISQNYKHESSMMISIVLKKMHKTSISITFTTENYDLSKVNLFVHDVYVSGGYVVGEKNKDVDKIFLNHFAQYRKDIYLENYRSLTLKSGSDFVGFFKSINEFAIEALD